MGDVSAIIFPAVTWQLTDDDGDDNGDHYYSYYYHGNNDINDNYATTMTAMMKTTTMTTTTKNAQSRVYYEVAIIGKRSTINRIKVIIICTI